MKDTGKFEVTILATERDAESAAVSFVCCLVQHLEASLQLAQTNVLSAAKHAPAHGNYIILALVLFGGGLILHYLYTNIFIIISVYYGNGHLPGFAHK